MTTLITGGGSQTGVALAHLLTSIKRPILFATRSGKHIPSHYPTVHFDWADASTFGLPFSSPQHEKEPIKYIYLLLPDDWDPLPVVKPFIDLAVEQKTVKRFVLLSAVGEETEKGPGSKGMGRVHTYLDELDGVDYVALRPTWFTENFLRMYGQSIKEHDVIETIVPTGRVPFVAVQDIAQVAFDGIVNPEKLPNRHEANIIGPDLLSYSQVAEIFSDVLGRTIAHRTITREELFKRYIAFGLPEEAAKALVAIEATVEDGSQEKLGEDQRVVVGKISVREWVEKNRGAFIR